MAILRGRHCALEMGGRLVVVAIRLGGLKPPVSPLTDCRHNLRK